MPEMTLWKVTMRRLGVVRSECGPFTKFIALDGKITSDKDAANYLKANHFTQDWWEETLLCDIEYVDELWYVQSGATLYVKNARGFRDVWGI